MVTIKPLRITRIKAELTHMQDVGGLRISSASYGVNLNNSFPALSDDGKFVYYFDDTAEELHRIKTALDLNESELELQDEVMATLDFIPQDKSISRIYWSADKNKLILSSFQDQVFSNWLYDINNKNKTDLTSSAKEFSFSPDGTKIAYISWNKDQGIANLNIANSDGTSERILKENINTLSSGLSYSNDNNKISYIYPSEKENKLVFYDLNTGSSEEQSLGVVYPVNHQTLWSNSDKYLLYSSLAQEKLLIVDPINKSAAQDIGIKPHNNLYDWLGSNNEFIVLEQDNQTTAYNLWLVNAQTNQKGKINRLEEDSSNNPQAMFATKDGKTIYLINNSRLITFTR